MRTQEIIAAEVNRFINSGATVHERDLAALEETIRNRLFNVPPEVKRTRVPLKSHVDRDEWATLTAYEAAKNAEDERNKAAKAKATQAIVKGELDKQMSELDLRRKDDAAYEDRMYQMEHADFLKWQEEEAAKAEKKRQLVERLKMERSAQLEDQMRRRQAYDDEKKKEDDEMRSRMKLEYSRKLSEEQKKFEKLKAEAVTLRVANEEAKAHIAATKQQTITEDLRFLKLQSDMYDQWEANRQAALDARKKNQDQQEVIAKGRAPAKRYIPDSIIEKNFQANEKMLDEREAARKQAVKDRNEAQKQALAQQLEEKLARKAKEQEEEARRYEQFKESVAAAERAELAKIDKQKAKRFANRDELVKQMEDNAARAKKITMSDSERAYNKAYIGQVNEYLEKTGQSTL